MSVWLERFDTVELPLIEAEQDIGAIGTQAVYFDLPGGGAYDAYGSEVAPRGMYRLSATGEIGNLTTQAEMQVQFDALRAKRGRRGKLYARMDDGTVRWVWARLPNIPMRRTVDNVLYLLANLQFDVTSPVWYGERHGGGWVLDSGEILDAGLVLDEATGDVFPLTKNTTTTFTVTNAGNATINDAMLVIDAGSDAMSSLVIKTYITQGVVSTSRGHLIFGGTVDASTSLIIDSATQSITNDGFDAYDDLTFGSFHHITPWIELYPLPTTTKFEISFLSTQDATATISFSDGWE